MSTSKGFSLFELLIVLSLFSVTTLILVPAFEQLFQRSQFDTEAGKLTIRLRACAATARQTQNVLTAAVKDRADCTLISSDSLSVKIESSDTIVFFPDGTSSGGELILSNDDRRLVVLVDPLTSLITSHKTSSHAY